MEYSYRVDTICYVVAGLCENEKIFLVDARPHLHNDARKCAPLNYIIIILMTATRRVCEHFESTTCDGGVVVVVVENAARTRPTILVTNGFVKSRWLSLATPTARRRGARRPGEERNQSASLMRAVPYVFSIYYVFFGLFPRDFRKELPQTDVPNPVVRKPHRNPLKKSVRRSGVLCPRPAAYEYGIGIFHGGPTDEQFRIIRRVVRSVPSSEPYLLFFFYIYFFYVLS